MTATGQRGCRGREYRERERDARDCLQISKCSSTFKTRNYKLQTSEKTSA
jgi:hypothetical protein